MRNLYLTLFLAAGICAGEAAAELPTVEVTKILDESSGGSFTMAQTGVIDGKKTFLKSNRGSQRGTRYSNFESDILARAIFEKLGVRCPKAQVVRLKPGAKVSKWLGTVVLAMQYVDTRMTHGKVVQGHWPGAKYATVDEFIDMALVDLIIGNGDRRGANFFVTVEYEDVRGDIGKPGSYRPVPIDNNCGFATMVVWSTPTSQLNFLPSYDGLGATEVMRDLGTIRNIAGDSEVLTALLAEKSLRKRILDRAKRLPAVLTDAFFGAAVEALPREILPDGVVVDPTQLSARLPSDFKPDELYGPIDSPLRGKALFEFRKAELKRVFAWRRDHLAEALERHWSQKPVVE